MVESAASQTSTSSSSGGGSHPNDSRRESLDPPPSHHRLSRSSAEGDDDSDCSSYPYLPLESSDTLNFTRRHSLPLSETRTPNSSRFGAPSRTSSEDSAQEDANPPQPGTLHRQYSLVERRRLVRQAGEQQHQHQQLATYASHRLANKRKLFASTRSPCHTVESVSAGSSFEQDPDVSHRVHFSFGPHEEDESNQTLGEEDGKLEPQRISRLIEEEKENLANSGRSDRRCSAPSTLLISQLGARSFSSSSRENSPTSSAIKLRATNNSKSSSGPNAASSFISRRLNLGQRRGSLPADLLDQQMMMISQPQNQQQPQQSCYHPSTSSSINPFLIGQRSSSCGRPGSGQDNKKKQRKKILRRRSGGAELTLTSSSSSPHRLNELGESTSVSPGSWSLSSASTSSSTGGGGGHQYRRAAHRHHQNRLNSRRGSAPMGMLFFSADSGLPSLSGKCGFYSKAAAGSGNHNPNNNNNNILRELQAVSRKVQVLRSGLSPSLEKEILENVHSSLAVLNGRRGSLPTDLNMMPSFVKS